jgi:beta-galactosidase
MKDLRPLISQGICAIGVGLEETDLKSILPGELEAVTESVVSVVDKTLGRQPEFTGISNAELHWRETPVIAALKTADSGKNPALQIMRYGAGKIILSQAAPWHFAYESKPYLRTTFRRNLFMISRLLDNSGALMQAPVHSFLSTPPKLARQDLSTGWKTSDETHLDNPADNCWRADYDDSQWDIIELPSYFSHLGYVWYRKTFKLEKSLPDDLTLYIGACDDESWIWLNGKFLGEVTTKTNPGDYWSFTREYTIPAELLNENSDNTIVVRVNNTYLDGGIAGKPAITTRGSWLDSYYIQIPEADDDPYRYYRW